MNSHLSSTAATASPHAVMQVVVTSRLALVAQAVCAGLVGRGFEARVTGWNGGQVGLEDSSADQLLLVLDDLRSRSAVDAVAGAVSRWRGCTVLLTSRRPGAAWGAVFAAGAADIASSDASLDVLQQVLRRVTSGQTHTEPRRRAAMEQQWAEWLTEEEELQQKADRLSPREASVLARLAEGQRVRDIGTAQGVSEATVRSQVKSLRRKLGADSQLGAVAMARRIAHRLPDGVPSIPMPRSG